MYLLSGFQSVVYHKDTTEDVRERGIESANKDLIKNSM